MRIKTKYQNKVGTDIQLSDFAPSIKKQIIRMKSDIHDLVISIDKNGVSDIGFIFSDDERKDEVGYLGCGIEEFIVRDERGKYTKTWNDLCKVWRIVRKEVEKRFK